MAMKQSDPSGVQHPGTQSEYYLVMITSTRYGDVFAWLPDDVRLWANSSWGPIVSNVENALANYVGTTGSLGVEHLPGRETGATFFSKKLTAQEWRGVEPLSLQLPLHFFATYDAEAEVVEPIKRLIKMSLPERIGAAGPDEKMYNLAPPGPVPNFDINLTGVNDVIGGINKELGTNFSSIGPLNIGAQHPEDTINVYIGNFIFLKRVFIASIPSIEFKAKLSKDGLPMEALCDVIFRTIFAPSSQDIDDWIGTDMFLKNFLTEV